MEAWAQVSQRTFMSGISGIKVCTDESEDDHMSIITMTRVQVGQTMMIT